MQWPTWTTVQSVSEFNSLRYLQQQSTVHQVCAAHTFMWEGYSLPIYCRQQRDQSHAATHPRSVSATSLQQEEVLLTWELWKVFGVRVIPRGSENGHSLFLTPEFGRQKESREKKKKKKRKAELWQKAVRGSLPSHLDASLSHKHFFSILIGH